MKRRACLAAFGAGALAFGGCLAIGEKRPVDVETKQVRVTDSACLADREPDHAASATFVDAARLELHGHLPAERPCDELFLDVRSGTGRSEIRDDAVLVDVDPAFVGECERCPAELTYEGALEFDRTPPSVYVHHVEQVSGEWRRIGPITKVSG